MRQRVAYWCFYVVQRQKERAAINKMVTLSKSLRLQPEDQWCLEPLDHGLHLGEAVGAISRPGPVQQRPVTVGQKEGIAL